MTPPDNMFALQNLHECKFTKLAQGRKGLSADELDKVVGGPAAHSQARWKANQALLWSSSCRTSSQKRFRRQESLPHEGNHRLEHVIEGIISGNTGS